MRNPIGLSVMLCLLVSACGEDSAGTQFIFGPGEARAGRLIQADLSLIEDGLAVYEAGDFFLANEHFSIFIEDEGASELYAPFGGLVVGISDVRFDEETGNPLLVDQADYNEMGIGLGRFLVRAETVTVLNDGRNGQAASIRAEGPLTPLPFLEDLLGTPGVLSAGTILLAGTDRDIDMYATRATVDYELGPDDEFVDVFYTLDATRSVLPVYLFIQSKRLPPYVPGLGFTSGTNGPFSDYPYMGYVDDDTVSYAGESPLGVMKALFDNETLALALGEAKLGPEISGVLPLRAPTAPQLEAGARTHLMRIHVGGPGVDGLRRAIASTESEPLRLITGTVKNPDGTPAGGVRVHAETKGTAVYLTRVLTNDDGTYELSVPADEDVQLTAFRRGYGLTEPLVVDAPATEAADIALPARGTLRVVATEDGNGIPVRVQVIPGDEYEPPANFGEQQLPEGDRLHLVFPTSGEIELPTPPGDYRVVVSRGYEYSILDDEFAVTANEETLVEAELERVVNSTDVLCGDWHIHTNRSPDAPDSAPFKLMSAAADGVELPVRTDHEFVAEFEPVVEEVGLGDWMYGLSSLELTTFSWGHFGVFPLEPDDTLINGGAIPWNEVAEDGTIRIFNPIEVFNDARSRPGNPEVIIFHPKGKPGDAGNAFSFSGGAYFEGAPAGLLGTAVNTGGVGLNPFLPPSMYIEGNGRDGFSEAEWWDTDFTAVEVFNDSSFEENRQNLERLNDDDEVVDDWGTVDTWFALLNSPEFDSGVFAVGSSDSHSVMGGSPVGYPRTCVATGTDDPQDLRTEADAPQRLKQLVSTGQSVINGGFYITAIGPGGVGPGGIVTAAGDFTVTVQAPDWVPNLTRVEMWYGGDGGSVDQMTVAVCDEGSTPGSCVDSGGGIDNSPEDEATRFSRSDVEVPAGASWVVFHARGPFEVNENNKADPERTLAPVHPRRLPFGVTNPIFFE